MYKDNDELSGFRREVIDLLKTIGYQYALINVPEDADAIEGCYIGPQLLTGIMESMSQIKDSLVWTDRTYKCFYDLAVRMQHVCLKTDHEKYVPLGVAQAELWNGLQYGIEYQYGTNNEKFGNAPLIDYDNVSNNSMLALGEWMSETRDGFYWDLIIAVNGLPLVGVVLKKTSEGKKPCEDAYEEMQRQMNADRLFSVYAQIMIISDGEKTLIGSPTFSLERFEEWQPVLKGDNKLKPALRPFAALLRPSALLKTIYDCETIFEDCNKEFSEKYVPRYQHFIEMYQHK